MRMGDNGNRAGLYERVSVLSKGRDDRSVRQQNAANAKACEQYGWVIAERYADPGKSASRFARRAREDYERLLGDITSERIDVIVFWESSRGGRELMAWAKLLDQCRRHRVKIYITNDDRLYDLRKGGDWHALAVEGVNSAYESEKVSDRVNRAMEDNAEARRPHGQTLFGYQRVYDEYSRELLRQEPDPQTSWIPGHIISRIAAGESLTSIVHDLRDRGAPTPAGGEWNQTLLRRIALNRAYIGQHAYRVGGRDPDPQPTTWWPAIADPADFHQAGDILRRRQGSLPGATRHLLSYLAACGVCGSVLTCGRRRGHASIYFCKDKGCVAIREDWLDAYVMGRVCARLDTPAFWDELLNADDPQVKAARAEVSELEQRLRGYRKRAAAGTIGEDAYVEIEQEIRPKLDDAKRRASVRSPSPLLTSLHRSRQDENPAAIRDLLETRPLAVRKEIIRELYDKIILMPAGRRGRWAGFDRSRVQMVPKSRKP